MKERMGAATIQSVRACAPIFSIQHSSLRTHHSRGTRVTLPADSGSYRSTIHYQHRVCTMRYRYFVLLLACMLLSAPRLIAQQSDVRRVGLGSASERAVTGGDRVLGNDRMPGRVMHGLLLANVDF